MVTLIHNTFPGIRFYIECVLVDENDVLCQFKASTAMPAGQSRVLLHAFFQSNVERGRISKQQHYWSLKTIETCQKSLAGRTQDA